MYTVYVIYNETANKFYIGQSQDIIKRIELHNSHLFKGYTSQFNGNWKLLYREEYKTRGEALIREKQLKSSRGRDFVKKNIPTWRSGSAVAC